MEFTLKLQAEDIRAVLAGLEELKHRESRRTFDTIFGQVQRQEVEAQQAAMPPATPE